MTGLVGVAALLTLLGLSLVVTRLATIALTMTGLSEEAARFQARSAFTGTGFTTSEAEGVVNHPVRRRIITILMVLRSAGLVSILLTLILSFVGSSDGHSRLVRLGILVGGVFVLWFISRIRWVAERLRTPVRWALQRWTRLDVRDYVALLKLSGEYLVTELQVKDEDWLAGKEMRDCNLRQEGITVLGIQRPDGSYVGVPTGSTRIRSGDSLIVYGRRKDLSELDERRRDIAGDIAHRQAVNEQREHRREQKRRDAEYEEELQERSGEDHPGAEDDDTEEES